MNLAVSPPDRPDAFLRGPQSLSGQSSPALTDCPGQASGEEEDPPSLHLHGIEALTVPRVTSSSSSLGGGGSKKRRKQSNPVRYGNTVPSPGGQQPQSGDEEQSGTPPPVLVDEEVEEGEEGSPSSAALDLGTSRRVEGVRCPHCGGLFASEAHLRLHVEEEHVQKLLEETIQQHQHLKSTSIDGRDHDSPKDFSLSKNHQQHHFQLDLQSKGRLSESDSALDARTDFARTFPFPGNLLHQYSSEGGATGKMPVPLFPGHMSPFLFPVMPPTSSSSNNTSGGQTPTSSSGSSLPLSLTNGGAGSAPSTTPTAAGGVRIFNPEAYCELCNKEFCNKYFLKTHKANKHGIYSVDSLVSAPYAGAFFANTLHPPPPSPSAMSGSAPAICAVSTPGVVTTSVGCSLPSLPPSLLALPPSSEASPSTPIVGTTRPSVINMESYCEICQKEFCNKYFLKKHKYKIHGIGEPSVPQHVSNTNVHSTSSSSNVNIGVITTTTPLMTNVNSPTVLNGERKSTSPAMSTTSGLGSSSPPSSQQPDRPLNPAVSEKTCFPSQQTCSTGEQRSGPLPSQGAEFTCEICKNEFPNLFTLQNHRLLAHGEAGVSVLLSPYNGTSGGGGTSPASASGVEKGEPGSLSSVFTPEKLREMGVINADAFCEICCKEFCNKYFLKTHKQNKHGIGGPPDGASSSSSNKPHSVHSSNSNSGPGPDKMDDSSHKSFEEFPGEAMFRFPGDAELQGGTGELNCEICNRPFSSAYLLKMHKFYTHNVPYIKEEGRSKPGSPSSIPHLPPLPNSGHGQQEDEAPTTTEDSANHDLQKLQSMIRELNATVSFESICSRTPCSVCHVEFENKYFLRAHMMNEHGVLPTEDGHIPFPYAPGGSVNATATAGNGEGEGKGDSEAYCELCNRDFCSKYFLKTHRQNIHGIPMDGFPVNRKPLSLPFATPHEKTSPQMTEQPNAQVNNTITTTTTTTTTTSNNNNNNNVNINNNNTHTSKLKANVPQIPTSSLVTSAAAPSPLGFPSSGQEDLNSAAGKQSRNVTGRNYCNICNKELCNKYFMKTHMLKMHGINLESQTGETAKSTNIGSIGTIGGVTCDICQKELCSKYFLKVHKQNTHGIFEEPPKDGPPSLVMIGSGLHGGSVDHLSLHRELLPGEVADTNNRYYSHYTEVCPLCDRRFKSIKWLKSHIVNDHSDVLKDNLFLNNHHLQPLLPQLNLMSSSNTPESSDGVLCLVCGQDFPDKTTLQLHLIRDHRTTSEELGMANHRSQGNSGQLPHHHHHSSKTTTQPLPDSSSSSAALLAVEGHPAPTSTASPGSPPLSPFRSSPSSSPVSGKHHLMSSAVKRFGLMGGTRIYQCSYCAYSTRWLSNLYAHEKRHAGIHLAPEGDKRFVCRLCHRSYRYNHSLQRHMLNHHRSFSKSNQPPVLHPQTTLSKDGKALIKMKRYRCSKCNRKFRTRDMCLAHIHAAHRKGNHNNNNNSGLNLSLANHQQQQQPTPPLPPPPPPPPPPQQQQQQQTVTQQQQQQTPVTGQEQEVDQERQSSQSRPSQKSSVRPYRCRLCPFATRSWNVLNLHINKLHPELPEDLSGNGKDRPQSNGGLPMTYAMPQNPPTAGSFIMQPFLLAQQPPEGSDTFVPSLVYLPVCHKISQPVTVAFSLTPA